MLMMMIKIKVMKFMVHGENNDDINNDINDVNNEETNYDDNNTKNNE